MSRRLGLFAVVAWAFAASGARADYQVRGQFLYKDRPFGPSGFTGNEPNLPIRLADVEVFDISASTVIASGATDVNGSFTINVIDNQVRNLRVRVRTTASQTPSLKLRVVNGAAGNAPYAVAGPDYLAHDPNTAIDFTASPVLAVQGSGGDPFNIWDNMLDGFDFAATLNGSRPARLLTVFWHQGSNDGTYYRHTDGTIHLFGLSSDSDGYDDTVILHELGHYIEFNLGDSDNPGGSHGLNGYYDLRLAWSEGWATFWCNMVRSWKGATRADIYVDTSGQPGAGHQFISYELETPSAGSPGANNEVRVNAALWDVFDGPGTADVAPGTDDDVLALANSPAEIWQVESTYFPTAPSISAEDFWDGWFSPGIANGFAPEMRAIFASHGIEYFADALEDDDTFAQARTVVGGSPGVHHTTYGVGDPDWIAVAVASGGAYTFETLNLRSGADTRLDLFQSNGSSLISSNDDRTTGDPSSRLSYNAPAAGLVYVRCTRKSDLHTYGSYDLVVTGPAVAVEITDVAVTVSPGDVTLRWRTTPESDLTDFEVERAADETGPFAFAGAADIDPQAGDPRAYAFTDAAVISGTTYYYRIVGFETDGTRRAFGPYGAAVPRPALVLHAPSPNPFNPTTLLGFELPRAAIAWVRVYSPGGRLVRVLAANRSLPAGSHTLRWDGRDDFGVPVASGVYVVKLDAAGDQRTQRAILVR